MQKFFVFLGNKEYEFKVGSSDFIVHIDWSINGDGLMICGFSNLSYCTVERNDTGNGWMDGWID